MSDDQILHIAMSHGFFPAMLAGGASAVAGKPEQFLPMLRAIEQASRRAALEEAGKIAFDFVFDRANAVEARKLESAIRDLADGDKA